MLQLNELTEAEARAFDLLADHLTEDQLHSLQGTGEFHAKIGRRLYRFSHSNGRVGVQRKHKNGWQHGCFMLMPHDLPWPDTMLTLLMILRSLPSDRAEQHIHFSPFSIPIRAPRATIADGRTAHSEMNPLVILGVIWAIVAVGAHAMIVLGGYYSIWPMFGVGMALWVACVLVLAPFAPTY
jgi:hypothetical protein